MKRKSGFTLVELLVVVAIIGVLAAVLIVGLNPLTQFKKARDARRKSNLREIKTGLELYYNVNGLYPASSGGQIVGCGEPASACNWGSEWKRGDVVYMKTLPADPLTTQSYQYTQETNNSYHIIATLEMTTDTSAAETQATCSVGSGAQYVACND